ncbi:tetraacyldisaccharide 4'-kinase [Marinomonas ostreistagni]|uniref:tetraacyldisaccharide 4'-kinase n=1 Tax=Marinomonas ostreistagni TaxID=359209 RepID=UPI00194FA4AD|nr:tetraacyldisaccharide 4'-kinase [Marinomonas ostreistagni]
MSLEKRFTDAWYQPFGWTWGLAPLLLLSNSYVKRKRRQYLHHRQTQSYQASVPVIVVGNISVGGTGKSPMVLALVELLKLHGFSPGIVTRGHKRQQQDAVLVTPTDEALAVGDEPLMLSRRASCPVAVAPKRVEAIKLLENTQQVDVIISDDGLQHYAMDRDIEIVMVDAQRGLGNRQLLPVGPLREPAERLEEVDFAFAIGEQFPLKLATPSFCAPLELSELRKVADSQQTMPLQILAQPSWQVVAGIGNPQRFLQSLKQHGLSPDAEQLLYSDHHDYTRSDLSDAKRVVMTEKDAVKVEAFAKPEDDWWFVAAKLPLPDSFTAPLIEKLHTIVKKKQAYE